MPVKSFHERNPSYFTINQVAKMFGASTNWVRYVIERHNIPTFRPDRRTVLIEIGSVRLMLQQVNRNERYAATRARLQAMALSPRGTAVDTDQPAE